MTDEDIEPKPIKIDWKQLKKELVWIPLCITIFLLGSGMGARWICNDAGGVVRPDVADTFAQKWIYGKCVGFDALEQYDFDDKGQLIFLNESENLFRFNIT